MLYKHTLTLTRLQSFCDSEGIIFLKDITLAHLTKWRAAWTFESPLAKRNNQERVKSFFKFCFDAGLSPTNPPGQLSSIQVKADESTRVSPLCLYACLRGAPRRGLSSRSMLCLRAVLRVRSRAISVPLTRNCTELAALDAICRGLSVWNYVSERFRIPLSPPCFQ